MSVVSVENYEDESKMSYLEMQLISVLFEYCRKN